MKIIFIKNEKDLGNINKIIEKNLYYQTIIKLIEKFK